jgi:hypothetical protein
MLSALDELPNKRLVEGELETDGEVCALGAVGAKRQIDMANIDPYARETVAATFAIPAALAAEIMYVNDDDFVYWRTEAPEARWQRVRDWVVGKIGDKARKRK